MDARPSEYKAPLDLVKLRGVWFTLSGIVIIAGIIGLATKGLNVGTDFTGGATVNYTTSQALPESDGQRAELVDAIASELGLGAGSVKAILVSDEPVERELEIRIGVDTQAELTAKQTEVEQQLEARFATELGDVTSAKDGTFVGPVIGDELRSMAVWCLILGLGLILAYIWWRYDIRMAAGGIIALAHDVLILLGAMALGGWEVNAPFVAAVLTVAGYSINDSVIIFDRIRENMQSRSAQRQTFGEVVNFALWQTMPRSINTTVTVLIVLACLLLLGGSTLHEFTIALLIGMACGAYSSIFTASQAVVAWEARSRGRQAATTQVAAAGKPTVGAKRRRQAELDRARATADEVSGGTADEPAATPVGPATTTKGRAQASKASKSASAAAKRKSKRRH